jgi:PAS domain S-box-containing protein
MRPPPPANNPPVSSALTPAENALRAEKESLERTVAENMAELRETKDYLENLLGYANAPIIVWDPSFKITRFNRAFERLTGRCAEAVLGMELSFLFPPDSREDSLAHIRRASAGEYWETVEIPIQHADGSVRLLLWNSAVVRSPKGEQIIATIAQGHDITARKKAEEALRLSGEQLRALSVHLQSLREEERTRIAREIHDELGQLLTGLKMDLHWAETRLEELKEPRLNPILDKLVAATEVADATITTVQRIASELRPGVLDRLGLMMALRHEIDQFRQRTGIVCHMDTPEEEPDYAPELATAFYRIFQETLTNVARHAVASAVQVAFRGTGAWHTLEVRDNGKGIDEAALTSPHALGLLGMQERAHLLGGTVAFQREATGGTIVTVRLPAALPHQPAYD